MEALIKLALIKGNADKIGINKNELVQKWKSNNKKYSNNLEQAAKLRGEELILLKKLNRGLMKSLTEINTRISGKVWATEQIKQFLKGVK